MDKYIIVGKAASGKDWLQRKFIENGYSQMVQYTTRPMRPKENGSEYHFITIPEFEQLISEGNMLSYKKYNNWYYGFTKDDFLKCEVAIMTPFDLNNIKEKYPNLLYDCDVIYLDISNDVRYERLSIRYIGGNEDDSIERRMKADEEDFKDFNIYNIRLKNTKEITDFINNFVNNCYK